MYANVVLGLPIEGPFTYKLPDGLIDKACAGKRAWVPFGSRRLIGYIVEIVDNTKVKNIKDIYSIIDENPVLSEDLLKIAKWISDYYFCSWGEAVEAALPSTLKKGKSHMRPPQLEPEDYIEPTEHLPPTEEQGKALKTVWHDIEKNKHNVYLLHGVTGSGKTEVYLQAIAKALDKKKTSIVLVPEISLTPQAIERFKARFKEHVAVLHSHLTQAQRFSEWNKIKSGESSIVVGARSAVFAPVKNLGLIVVDEEHEASYKQQDAPRYHARDVAVKRAYLNDAVVILGSATPSLESYYNARSGSYKFLNLTKRTQARPLPGVQVIDMRHYMNNSRRQAMLSRPLQEAIKSALDKKEQAILFLNRRGFATFMNCRKCGFVIKCKHCEVSLTYHFQSGELVCHWCGFKQKPPNICPKCSSSYINYFGTGTEKVESEISRLFVSARVNRMDTDATSKRGSHKMILDGFKSGHTQLLVGTQMIAKGLDFPGVTLVGVVSADSTLHIPDFRSGERTFSLLTQVSGRAGRGSIIGKVLVQTFTPEHYAITLAAKHDYVGFFEKEIELRKELKLPPYSHIVKITFRSKSSAKAFESASKLAAKLTEKKDKNIFSVAGPAVSWMSRLRKEYRWDVILKAKHAEDAVNLLRRALSGFKKASTVKMAVDVDPL